MTGLKQLVQLGVLQLPEAAIERPRLRDARFSPPNSSNFDKLIEMASAQQAVSEYQAIRSEDERQCWGDEEKQYVIKLHGDQSGKAKSHREK
jgi:hypothetical protein